MALSAEAIPTSAEVSEMRAGLSAEEVRRRLAGAVRREETGQRLLAFYLVEMDARRLHQDTGHSTTAYYAEARLGLDRRRTAELLRVGRKLLELREVDRAFCAGRLGWAKVLVVARMAVPEHEAAWLERALALDVRALSLLASRSKEGGAPRRPGDEKGLPEIRFPLNTSLPPLEHAKLDAIQRQLNAELGREVDLVETFGVLFDLFQATVADGSAPGRKRVDASAFRVVLTEMERGGPLYVQTEDGPVPIDTAGSTALSECVRCDAGGRNEDGHDHRARDVKTPPAMRRRVLRRDGHCCRSCRSRWSLTAHHIEFRSHGGRTLPQNLITVCTRCHGLVHENLLIIEGNSAEGARFLDAARRPLIEVKPGAPIEPPPPAPAPEPGVVTLASIPPEVDTTWWRRHAHLIRDRGEHGGLRFDPGAPKDAPQPCLAPPASPGATFQGLIGQDDRVARLRCELVGSRKRGTSFPHVLFTGPAGTGKTTIARAIAAEAQRPLVEVSAPNVTVRSDWIRTLAGLPEGCVLFVDEAHALPRPMLEVLLQALSERRLTLTLSDGVEARQVTLCLADFTLVAATTDEGAIPPALHSRFGLREAVVHYGEDVLAKVVRVAAAERGAEATEEGALRLARASRGTPREALRLLDRVLNGMSAHGEGKLDAPAVERALERLGYDADDLNLNEQRYLAVLRASPVPIPLGRFARMLGTTQHAVVEHLEPWLFVRGLVRTTSAGRVATPYVRRDAAAGAQADAGAPNVRQEPAAVRSTS